MNLLPGREGAQPRPRASRPPAPPPTSEPGLASPGPHPLRPRWASGSPARPRCSVSPSLAPPGNCRGLERKRPLRSASSGLQTKREGVARRKIDWRLGCYSGSRHHCQSKQDHRCLVPRLVFLLEIGRQGEQPRFVDEAQARPRKLLSSWCGKSR